MKKKYTIAHYGLGHRGNIFLNAFQHYPERFEIIALGSRNSKKLDTFGKTYKVSNLYNNARDMIKDTRPDIFSFVTPPSIRLPFVKIAEEFGIKAIYFEKPIATSIKEAYHINEICKRQGIKAVVSHQCKYLTSMQKLKEIIESGQLGEITHIHAATVPWLAQLGTHFTDYLIWANGGHRARWAVGHVHGKHHLDNDHPSADYILGEIALENGIHAYIQCGYLSPASLPQNLFWLDDKLTFYGTNGFAWADNYNRWSLLSTETLGKVVTGQGVSWREEEEKMQILFNQDFISWLDNDEKKHPSDVSIAYHGYEVLHAIQNSALERIRVDLPLNPTEFYDLNARLKAELPDMTMCREWIEHGNPT